MPSILGASCAVRSELCYVKWPCPESCSPDSSQESLQRRTVPQAGPQGCHGPSSQNAGILIDLLPGQMGMELEMKAVSFFSITDIYSHSAGKGQS